MHVVLYVSDTSPLPPHLHPVFLSCYYSYVLFDLHRKTNRYTYAGTAEEMFGKRGKMWVDWVLIVDSIGVCVGKLVLISNQLNVTLYRLAQNYDSFPPILYNKVFLLSVISVFVLLPLSLKRTLHELRFASLFSILCILYLFTGEHHPHFFSYLIVFTST